jgi:serine/threonine-protein phosphatase 2A regulatory subunit B
LQADKSAFKTKKVGGRGKNAGGGAAGGNGTPGKKEGIQTEGIDFAKKILHASWHPQEDTIAVSLFCVVWVGSGWGGG